MRASKWKPFGICSWCLGNLEAIDFDLKTSRHMETKIQWAKCPEGLRGENAVARLVKDVAATKSNSPPRKPIGQPHVKKWLSIVREEPVKPAPPDFSVFKR